jgi:deferrochelatase/peroxidase EfeB
MTPVDRRRFLTRSLAALGAGSVGLATGVGLTSTDAQATITDPPLAAQANAVDLRQLDLRIPFDGAHQAGVVTPRQDQATLIAFDSIAPNSAGLFEALQAITTQARLLTQGDTVGVTEIDDPPPDSGILGEVNNPDSLTVTVGFGSTLFDDRYGLASKLPAGLTAMKPFPQDELDPTITGGDLIVQICAGQRDTVMHAARTLVSVTAGKLTPRWMIDGFQLAYRGPHSFNSRRNLFAFRDGTGNPDVNDAALMDKLIWIDRGSAAPDWTAGGTNMVVRRIRQFVEFWDRVGMLEQEQMIGRYRVTGAPLGGSTEFENPDYAADPLGKRIPLTAHIRIANDRTAEQERQRILRRPYSYNVGVDEAGNLDQGMLFIAFNRDTHAQFEQIQKRLENEPMIDYIKPVGGGYFFVPRATTSQSDWIGSGLAAAL